MVWNVNEKWQLMKVFQTDWSHIRYFRFKFLSNVAMQESHSKIHHRWYLTLVCLSKMCLGTRNTFWRCRMEGDEFCDLWWQCPVINYSFERKFKAFGDLGYHLTWRFFCCKIVGIGNGEGGGGEIQYCDSYFAICYLSKWFRESSKSSSYWKLARKGEIHVLDVQTFHCK